MALYIREHGNNDDNRNGGVLANRRPMVVPPDPPPNPLPNPAPSNSAESTIPDKAWSLVEAALTMQTESIQMIATDDIFFLAERLLEAQMEYKCRGINCYVDIAYHHTRSENLSTIKTDGLLSRNEREGKLIFSHFNGNTYGDGIYCSSDPFRHAGTRYGDTTLLVARMKGRESKFFKTRMKGKSSKGCKPRGFTRDFDTLDVPSKGICVLKNSYQCVPLFHFKTERFRNETQRFRNDVHFRGKLKDFHRSIQTLLDRIFNDGIVTPTRLDLRHPHRHKIGIDTSPRKGVHTTSQKKIKHKPSLEIAFGRNFWPMEKETIEDNEELFQSSGA